MKAHLLVLALPLLGFWVNILLGRRFLRDRAHWVAVAAVLGAWAAAMVLVKDVLQGQVLRGELYTWIVSDGFKVSIGFLVDELTAVMLVVVTTVSALVHIYSIGYMHGDGGYYRFFAYLNLFTFSMLLLVMADNFLLLYLGWEAVGLCSYLLIGYWFQKRSAADAGKKAFIVNRFGDFGFGLGVILIFLSFGTLEYAQVFSQAQGVLQGRTVELLGLEPSLATVIALLLFSGAVGKSAQLPLHVWLPDAMEGPTPVSALIHAATMVTAGVFMVARCSPLFELSPAALATVAVVGALTALFAATVALVQNDIKRIIAYSTISQLGYMFLACGVGAYGAGIFHLYTHAFFKALLFLGAGSVMHAMAGQLDIKKMGGLRHYMPWTYWTFLLASLSIAGLPGLAGFFSKDEILWSAFASATGLGRPLWALGTVAAALTAFYSFRVVFLAFHGDFRGTQEQRQHLHESPPVMTIPLAVLAVGAVAAGWVGIPEALGGHNQFGHFLEAVLPHPELHGTHAQEYGVMALSVAAALGGIAAAWWMYVRRPELPLALGRRFGRAYRVLWNKYYVDELYHFVLVRPVLWVAHSVIEAFTDQRIIEGVVNGLPALIGRAAQLVRRLQSGILQHYAAMTTLGLLLALAVMLLLGGRG